MRWPSSVAHPATHNLLTEKDCLQKAYIDHPTDDDNKAAFYHCRRLVQQRLREMQNARTTRKAKKSKGTRTKTDGRTSSPPPTGDPRERGPQLMEGLPRHPSHLLSARQSPSSPPPSPPSFNSSSSSSSSFPPPISPDWAKRRDAGVTFAILNDIVGRLPCLPLGINDRLMSLRFSYCGGEITILVNIFAPPISSPDETRNKFYAELHTLPASEPTIW
ncbi:hypothetical protein SprV_1002871900 [Sparganum proliferum]